MKIFQAKTDKNFLLNGNLTKAVLMLAIPVIINNFLQTMYNLTDTFWLGKLGTYELAAINLITPAQNAVINFGSGITMAGSILISQYMGAKQEKEAKSVANQIFVCAMLFSAVCCLLCFMGAPGIVNWLGADSNTYVHSVTYFRIVILDMPFLFMVNIFQATRQSQGDTVSPMLLNFSGILLNMILDPVLMVVCHFGVAGAAVATLVSKAFTAVIAFGFLGNRRNSVHLDIRFMKPDKEKIKAILSLGLPSSIGGCAQQLGFLLLSKNVFVYGAEAMAAYGIGNKVNSLLFMPCNAVASATGTIVGQNMGANQIQRAEKGYLLCRRMCVVFMFVGGLIMATDTVSTAVVSLFSDDPVVIKMAAEFHSILTFWCWSMGVYNVTNGLFRGAGHTRVTMIVDICRLWLIRFSIIWIGENILKIGVYSVWYSVALSNLIAAGIMYTLYKTGVWKKNKVKIKKSEENKND